MTKTIIFTDNGDQLSQRTKRIDHIGADFGQSLKKNFIKNIFNKKTLPNAESNDDRDNFS